MKMHTAKTMELKWIGKPKPKTRIATKRSSFPIYISTKPSHVRLDDLRRLYAACNLSGHRFPPHSDSLSPDARKLRLALRRSAFVVSVFAKGEGEDDDGGEGEEAAAPGRFESLLQSVVGPVGPYNGELVGFGRAVSDLGLTAAIYDVMVVPSLRRMGIGRLIVHNILRMITSKGIYDVAALCSEDERPFFEACGFRDDEMGSTTMMYTRSVSDSSEPNDQMAKRAGRKLLLIPQLKIVPPANPRIL